MTLRQNCRRVILHFEVKYMQITGSCRDGVLTLRFSGELDHHAAHSAIRAIQERIDAFLPARCVLDLSGLTFMDSSGIALLLRADRLLRELEGSLTVTGLPEQPGRVLRASGMAKRLNISD